MPKMPHTKEEKTFRAQGYARIAGVDEVGRGAWAGPLVTGAVILPEDFKPKQIRDSKLLTPKMREKMFVHITIHAVSWAVAVAPAEEIDKQGIGKVNRARLKKAAQNLHLEPQAILVDALKFTYDRKPVKAIIHGDTKVLSIAAASIVAKVVRDELMRGFHRLYPAYEFHTHKGYGTRRHQALLKKHGPSLIHRMTWTPMNGQPVRRKTKVAKKAG